MLAKWKPEQLLLFLKTTSSSKFSALAKNMASFCCLQQLRIYHLKLSNFLNTTYFNANTVNYFGTLLRMEKNCFIFLCAGKWQNILLWTTKALIPIYNTITNPLTLISHTYTRTCLIIGKQARLLSVAITKGWQAPIPGLTRANKGIILNSVKVLLLFGLFCSTSQNWITRDHIRFILPLGSSWKNSKRQKTVSMLRKEAA